MKSSVHVNLSCLHLSLWRKTCFVENPVTMDAMTVRRCHHNGSKTGHRLVNYAVLWGSGRGRGWGSRGKGISGSGTSATQWCRGVIGDKNHIQVLKSKSWNLKWAAIPHPQKYTCIHLLRGLVLSWNHEIANFKLSQSPFDHPFTWISWVTQGFNRPLSFGWSWVPLIDHPH